MQATAANRIFERDRPAKAPSVSHLREHLAHLDKLELLGPTAKWLEGVPPRKVEHSPGRRGYGTRPSGARSAW